MYLRTIYIFPLWAFFRISIFLYHMRDFSAQPQEQREGQGTSAKHGLAAQSPALPTAPAVESRVHINNQHTNFQFGKLRIINGNNYSL